MDVPQELTLTGTTRIEDLLFSLPQVFPGQNSAIANGSTGTASIDLRLLGTVRSLVLLNGRRLAFGDPWGVDVNAVPAALVKRVDVLTGGASTVYGSDAVAGVVNFILDTDFTGLRGGIQYSVYQHDNNNALAQEINEQGGFDYPSGVTWDGGALNAYLAIGGSFADERGHGSVYVDYRNIDELVKASRDYVNCSVDLGDDGPVCGGSRTTPSGTFTLFGPNSDWVGDYTLDLSEEGGDGHSFRPWDGEYFNYGPYNHIQRPDEKWNAGGFAHYTINQHFEAYLEIMFMRDFTKAQIAPSGVYGSVKQINCDSPMLSDQQRDLICTQFGYGPDEYAHLIIRRRNIEGGPRIRQMSNTNSRLVAGLRGDINDSWSYDLYGLQAERMSQWRRVNDLSSHRIANALDIIVDPDTGEWVCRSGDPGCVPWNIFREGGVTEEAIDYLSTVVTRSDTARTRVVKLTFTGDLEDYSLVFPSASEGLQIAAGAEYRSEFLEIRPDEAWMAVAGSIPTPALSEDYDVNELFVEALVPLVQDTKGFRDLSFELGYRYSDYSTSGGVDTYKGLLNWAITDSWRLRGGYNRAVRAPTVFELYRPQYDGIGWGDICENDVHTGVPEGTLEQCLRTGVTEEQYGNIPSQGGGIKAIWGGNPLLTPEVADTVTAGLVWTPQAIPGLSVATDYYHIEITEAIDSLWAAFIISFCADTGDPHLCSLIHRDEVGSLWLSPDAYVDETLQNISLKSAEGVDLNVNYLIGLGDAGILNTFLVGSYLLSQRSADPSYDFDCAGYYGDLCGQPSPKWRHRLRATWESNFNLKLSLTWRRVGASEIDAASSDPDLSDPEWLEVAMINGIDTTRAYDWFDLAASYTWKNGIKVTLGVKNIFDKEPPLMPWYADWTGTWFNLYGNYDPLGRHIFASLQFNF
jgi:outer membrane receptor protein involved in Fe transport